MGITIMSQKMSFAVFYNFNDFWDNIGRNVTYATEGTKIAMTDINTVRFEKENHLIL